MDDQNPPQPFELGEPPGREGVDELKRLLAEAFPAEAEQTDEEALDLWGSDEASSLWFNGFARRTNEAILRRDAAVVAAHFEFFAAQLAVAGPDVASIIDVNYVENLLSRMDDQSERWGWNLMPANLRECFVAFWGEIAPRRMERLRAG